MDGWPAGRLIESALGRCTNMCPKHPALTRTGGSGWTISIDTATEPGFDRKYWPLLTRMRHDWADASSTRTSFLSGEAGEQKASYSPSPTLPKSLGCWWILMWPPRPLRSATIACRLLSGLFFSWLRGFSYAPGGSSEMYRAWKLILSSMNEHLHQWTSESHVLGPVSVKDTVGNLPAAFPRPGNDYNCTECLGLNQQRVGASTSLEKRCDKRGRRST